MGSGDSKLGKQLEEEFSSTEKYYGFYNVRRLCFTVSALVKAYETNLDLLRDRILIYVCNTHISMVIHAMPTAYYRLYISVNLFASLCCTGPANVPLSSN